MNPDPYLNSVLTRHSVSTDLRRLFALGNAQSELERVIRAWTGSYLNYVQLSGSNAKGTAIKGSADLDLFISLKTGLPYTFNDVHKSLHSFLMANGHSPRFQNSSIGLTYGAIEVDLVPGKLQSGAFLANDHSIYVRKKNTWVKTNVSMQIEAVKKSGRTDLMKLTKIWRDQHHLDFPSFYLELSAMNASMPLGLLLPISKRFVSFLEYLRDDFETATVYDPGNRSNAVSDVLSPLEKRLVANAAAASLRCTNWNQVVV